MLSVPAAKVRMVRVTTYGKALEAIEQEAVLSVNNGNQVLVNAACASDTLPNTPGGPKAAVAAWAETLSHQHGFVWKRVGLDVLFLKATA
jgi:hypothetical protein